jgi:hypothetical protein
MLLQDHCEAVMHASSRDELQRVLVCFAHDLGFGLMAAAAVYDQPGLRPEFIGVNNVPVSYLPMFQGEVGQSDPVMQHCKHSSLPIAWNQTTYTSTGHGEKWEEMAPYGYKSGICMALHLPYGRHFVLGVDGDRPLPKQQRQLSLMLAYLASVLMYAQETAFCLLPSRQGDSKGSSDQPTRAELLSGRCMTHPVESARSKGLVLPFFKLRPHRPVH